MFLQFLVYVLYLLSPFTGLYLEGMGGHQLLSIIHLPVRASKYSNSNLHKINCFTCTWKICHFKTKWLKPVNNYVCLIFDLRVKGGEGFRRSIAFYTQLPAGSLAIEFSKSASILVGSAVCPNLHRVPCPDIGILSTLSRSTTPKLLAWKVKCFNPP